MRCCVYTRFVYEIPYIDSFIEYYINLGFDKIIIMYHDIIPYDLSENLIEEVEIIQVENNGNKLLNEYKYLLNSDDYDWVLNVDSDEFLVLDDRYNTIKEYISEKLIEHDENINMFQFSWGWIHAFNPPIDYTINDYINRYNIFVGSKDTESNDIWVKSMTKISDIEYITCHNCVLNKQAIIYVDSRLEYHNSCDDDNNEDAATQQISFAPTIINKENDHTITSNIDLLPRFYTKRENTYSEAILIHINTRNMMNAIIKGLNIHTTQVKQKRIKKFKELKNFVNNYHDTNKIYKEIFDQFVASIGYKMQFPLQCLEKEIINEKIMRLKNSTEKKALSLSLPLCNIKYIPDQNKYHLDILQEKMSSLFYVLDMNKFLKILNSFSIILENTFLSRVM